MPWTNQGNGGPWGPRSSNGGNGGTGDDDGAVLNIKKRIVLCHVVNSFANESDLR